MDFSLMPFLAVAVIIGISLYKYFFSAKAKINRKLKNAPSKKIADFTNGETARIIGTILPVDDELKAPLSNRNCVHYTVLVEEQKSNSKNSNWSTLIEKEETTKIFIQDGEHFALVANQPLMRNIVIDKEYSSGFLKEPTVGLKSFLKKHQIDFESFFGFNKSIRYKEGILERDEKIAVLGQGEWKSAEELGLPTKYGQVLLVSANKEHAIYLSDDPKTTVVKMIKQKKNERYNKRYLK